MKHVLRLLLLTVFVGGAFAPLRAQEGAPPEPLEQFVVQVARLWAAGDASRLVDLAPADGRIMLDIGESMGAVQARHAAAALRALFSDKETTAIRPTRVTIAGGRPMRGFGELAWSSRSRGMSDVHTATLYVGTVWEGGSWRVRELRILR